VADQGQTCHLGLEVAGPCHVVDLDASGNGPLGTAGTLAVPHTHKVVVLHMVVDWNTAAVSHTEALHWGSHLNSATGWAVLNENVANSRVDFGVAVAHRHRGLSNKVASNIDDSIV